MEVIKKKQSEIKDTFMKWRTIYRESTVEDEAENQISDLEYKEAKTSVRHQEEKRTPQNEDSVRSLWDNFKSTNIHIMGVPEGEERRKNIWKNNDRKLP